MVVVQKMFRGDEIVSREHSTYVVVDLNHMNNQEIPRDLVAEII